MNHRTPVSTTVTLVRRSARLLSGIILFVWGYFLIADLFGEAGQSSGPLTGRDAAILATLVLALTGLAVAWRWEAVGAILSLVAVFVCAALNWRVLIFPGTLIPITAMLFLAASWLSARRALEGPAGLGN